MHILITIMQHLNLSSHVNKKKKKFKLSQSHLRLLLMTLIAFKIGS